MRRITKDKRHSANIERFELNNIPSDIKISKGLAICYTLATCNDIDFENLDVRAKKEEIGMVEDWHYSYNNLSFRKSFSDIFGFIGAYDDDDFGVWKLTIRFNGEDMLVIGERESTEVSISYREEAELNLTSLIETVEKAMRNF